MLASVHHPNSPSNAPDLSAFEGQFRWVTPVAENTNPKHNCQDSASQNTYFRCATLGCTPQYRDWDGELGTADLHITGDAVVPSSIYSVQIIPQSAGTYACCSCALNLATAKWGNVNNDSQNLVNASDIAFVVDKVKDATPKLKRQAQLHLATPNPLMPVSASDIGRSIDAVKGHAYPFTISVCP